jgi:hypothetical protein
MANTYSSSLRLIIQQDGTNQGTWGGYTNTNIATLLEQAVAGIGNITVSGSSNYTLTSTNGASDEARNAVLNITGTLTAAINVICPTAAKTYIVKNGTTGGYAITLKTSAGTGISVPNGSTMLLYCDGTNVVEGVTKINGTATNATTATNLAGGSAGSIPYQTASGATSQLAAGTNGYILTLSGGLPTWSAPATSGVTSFSAGTTGLTPNTATTGGVTLSGTLGVANGGTGVTTSTGTGNNVLSASPTLTGTVTAATVNMTTPQYGGVAMSRMVQGTAQNTTSGTAIDFTGIPSWVKRITVMLNGVSTNGASYLLLRIGSGSVQTTGYDSTASAGTASGTFQSNTTGFILTYPAQTASSVFKGMITLCLIGSNTWVSSGNISDSVYQLENSGSSGNVTLSGTLDRIRLTTVNGTDAFDAGSVNILYEG